MPLNPPYRVMVTGCGTPTLFDAPNEERRDVFLPRFRQMIAEWEELGARPLASFVDDVFQMGETDGPFWAWYLIFEVDTVAVAAPVIHAGRRIVSGGRGSRSTASDSTVGSGSTFASGARSSRARRRRRTTSSTPSP